jgi:preprotein translocase subunit SecY
VNHIVSTLRSVWRSRSIRGKLAVTLALTALFRFLAHVPLLGVNTEALKSIFSANQFLGVLNIFSGGTLANFSVLAVGVSPYITASIIMQVAGVFFPTLKEMQRESEATRAQVTQWTRFLAVPVAVLQSLSLILLLRTQGLITATQPTDFIAMILSLVAGAMVVMWVGELLTRHGIGNGMSWLIFIGIISQIPLSLSQTWALRNSVPLPWMIALMIGAILVILSVIITQEAIRKVPIQQARRQRGTSEYTATLSYLPLKVTQFGVMPVIFALPILSLPPTIANLLLGLDLPANVLNAVRPLQIWFAPGNPVYNILYFVLVFAFTFFSIAVYFQPTEFAKDLKKSGTFIPGIRPGAPTAEFLLRTLLRLSFLGGSYLGIVALLPILAQSLTGITTLTIGGTGILIVVSVVLETVRSVQAQLVHDQYEQYL